VSCLHPEKFAICPDCGAQLLGEIERLQADADNAWAEVRKKQAQISRLTGERNRDRRLDPFYEDANECWDYYREHVNSRMREFNDERYGHTVARLRGGHDLDSIKRALDGLAARPYVTALGRAPSGEQTDRYDDMKYAVRDEASLIRFIGYAEADRPRSKRLDHVNGGGYPDADGLAMLIAREQFLQLGELELIGLPAIPIDQQRTVGHSLRLAARAVLEAVPDYGHLARVNGSPAPAGSG
jgi:hypothetical protein